ncbi:MAG: MoxR family ATPase [Chloroflexi bacterium]|nr:MoxR family ATPase [Chloroflexota bacterium]
MTTATAKLRVEEKAEAIVRGICDAIVAPEETVRLIVLGLLCQGHVLIDDFPGVGKTLLAKCLAGSVQAVFRRIQFTPDLLPSDITGGEVYDQKSGKFNFVPGPVFGNIILADEINRAIPRTQSALLEAMGERQVSCDGVTRHVPDPFVVVATQNEVEFESTFPLPYAQLDRFMLSLKLGYPGVQEQVRILERNQQGEPTVEPATSTDEVLELHREVCQVKVSRPVMEYIALVVQRTRTHSDIQLGVSPRGAVALQRAAQCRAAMSGRDYVTPADVKAVCLPVVRHRLVTVSGRRDGPVELVRDILESVPTPF